VVVVIDVLRAFTVSAYALAGGATRCVLAGNVELAIELGRELNAEVAAEVGGLPVPGIANSNSPTMTQAADLRGRVLVQRSSSGVQAALAARDAGHLFAAALVNAAATARAVAGLAPDTVTLVASGAPLGHAEDRICAELIARHLRGEPPPPLKVLLAPVHRDPRYRRARAGEWPGCPASDMDLSLAVDRFDFAMAVEPDGARPDCATLYRR
jgi:2-phosphosulfolactate phosphatase